ncbi:hypothetical protein pb186bvf_015476 [Paramecium bursaria]
MFFLIIIRSVSSQVFLLIYLVLLIISTLQMGTVTCSSQKQPKDPRRRRLTKTESNDLIASLSSFEDAKTAMRLYNYSVCQIIPVFQPLLKKKSSKEPNVIKTNRMISKMKDLIEMHELATDFGRHVTQIDVFLALTIMETYIAMKNLTTNMDLMVTQDYFFDRIDFLNHKFKFQGQHRRQDKSLEGMIDTLIKCETTLYPWVANIFNINYDTERAIVANIIGNDLFNVVKDLSNNF